MAIITGTAGDDTLPGPGDPANTGNDTISGLEGNDVLYGGDADDLLLGGDGDDLLDGGDGNDTLYGHAGVNTLQGWAGNDILYAAGNDSVNGGAGNDTLTVMSVLGSIYDGGANTDSLTLDFSAAGAGATVNLTNLFLGLNGSVGTATVSSFEAIAGTIFGSGFADSITISQNYASAVTMLLGAGNDTGIGGSIGDTLSGGDGNDTLQGLDGNDALSGDFGSDTLTGGNGNDTLYDSDGIGTLNGDAGDDTVILGVMSGGSANGGSGYDYLRFDLELAVSGVAISLNASGGVVSGSVGGVGIAGFESLNGAFNKVTNHNDTVTLGAGINTAVIVQLLGGNDAYSGGSGNDYIEGGTGDDTLGGGVAGTDTLFGGSGNDSFVVDNATTTLNEGAGQGTDTVLASLAWSLADNFENLTLTGFGNINGYGNNAANVITGNNGNNRIEAGGGNDTINGGSGQDFLYGMAGNDTVNGEGGNDSMEDGEGTNTLNGGGGDDYIVVSGDAVNTVDGGAGTADMLLISKFNRTAGFVIDLTGLWSGGSGIVNGGTVTGIELLQGFEGTPWADVINFGAGTSADGVGINDAGAGDDILTGTDGNNYINGGEGNDTIVSGKGADDLLGGAGNDTITIRPGTSGTVDGGAGIDTLGLARFDFEPAVALNIDFTLLWSGGSGTFNGVSVTGIELLQADFIQGAAPFFLSVDDSVVIGAGYTGNLNMAFGTGADSVSGGSGNDIIDGAQDNDVIHGGGGNDSLGGSYGSDYVYGDAGDDTIGGDTLDGEWAWGNDHLYGGDGNDTIEGGAYQDWLYGDAGNDLLLGDSLALNEGDNGTDTLEGGTGDDQLFGLGGNDALLGGDGVDVLDGGTGGDTLSGGLGNDTYYVDNLGDVVSEAAGQGVDVVYSGASYALAAGSQVEYLSTILHAATTAINLVGNELDNYLIGNAGANSLIGGAGADVLLGLGGNDTYYLDQAGDIVIEATDGGIDVVYTSTSLVLGANLEIMSTLLNAATTAIDLTGNELANTIVGNAGANTLNGGSGADVLQGLGGNDTYYLDQTGDVVTEAADGGIDAVYANFSLILGVNLEIVSTVVHAATDAINLTGNELANTIIGNAGGNVLNGAGGADTLLGLGGNDTYYVDQAGDLVLEAAGGGSDVVYAAASYALGAGAEVETLSTNLYAATDAIGLIGNEFANMLIGNAGGNLLVGGGGADVLYGLDGADIFAFNTAPDAGNVDAVMDFVAGSDKIALDDGVFAGLGAGALPPSAFIMAGAAGDADYRVVYSSATGALFFDADGTGAAVAVQFATLAPGLGLAATDFMVI